MSPIKSGYEICIFTDSAPCTALRTHIVFYVEIFISSSSAYIGKSTIIFIQIFEFIIDPTIRSICQLQFSAAVKT